MARTVQNIIDEVKDKRIPWITQSEGVQYVNDTHKEIIAMLPPMSRLAWANPVTIAVVIGTREYILPLTLNQIERVEFTPTAGVNVRLDETSIENINHAIADGNENETWITQPASVTENSKQYYFSPRSDGLYIGLNPLPTTTGSLKILGSTLGTTLVASDQVLPLYSDEVYLEGVCYRLMKGKRNGALAVGFNGVYDQQLAKARNWLLTFAEEFKDKDMINGRIA